MEVQSLNYWTTKEVPLLFNMGITIFILYWDCQYSGHADFLVHKTNCNKLLGEERKSPYIMIQADNLFI